MAEFKKITPAPGLTFDALVAGAPGAPLILLLLAPDNELFSLAL